MRYAALKYCTARLEEMSDYELMTALQSANLAQDKFPGFIRELKDWSNRVQKLKAQVQSGDKEKPISEKWLSKLMNGTKENADKDQNMSAEQYQNILVLEQAAKKELKSIKK